MWDTAGRTGVGAWATRSDFARLATRSEREHREERVVDTAVDGLASREEGRRHRPRRWWRCGFRRRRRGCVRWQFRGQAGERPHRRRNLQAVRVAHPPRVIRLLIADRISVPGFALPRVVGAGCGRHDKRRRGHHRDDRNCREPHSAFTTVTLATSAAVAQGFGRLPRGLEPTACGYQVAQGNSPKTRAPAGPSRGADWRTEVEPTCRPLRTWRTCPPRPSCPHRPSSRYRGWPTTPPWCHSTTHQNRR